MSSWTRRQRDIMSLIVKGYSAGALLDIDELMDLLANGVSKQATQCSIRFLEKRGVVKRTYHIRRNKRRMVIEPTPSGVVEFGVI